MIKLKDLLEGKLTEIKTLPSGEIQKRMRKTKYWQKVGKGFEREVGKKFRGRKVSEKALDKMLPDYIDGKQIHALFIGAWTEGKLTEGKFQMKGKYLYFPDGELSSIPGNNDRDAIMVQIKRDTFGIYMNQGKLYAVGSYDKTFKNGNDLANWLNKEKAKYLGIDNR
jgi:hypothetical protein